MSYEGRRKMSERDAQVEMAIHIVKKDIKAWMIMEDRKKWWRTRKGERCEKHIMT